MGILPAVGGFASYVWEIKEQPRGQPSGQPGEIDANASNRVRVIYIKLKQRQAFPMTFDEALNPSPLPPQPAHWPARRSCLVNHPTHRLSEFV